MGLKSAWAYRNGKRIMRDALHSVKDEKTGWIEKGGNLYYAERYEPTGKLMIKTYASFTQASRASKKLYELGFYTVIGMPHPFTIIKLK